MLTPAGQEVSDQLIGAVRTRLEGLLEGWSPYQYPELARVLDNFATDVVPGRGTLVGAGAELGR